MFSAAMPLRVTKARTAASGMMQEMAAIIARPRMKRSTNVRRPPARAARIVAARVDGVAAAVIIRLPPGPATRQTSNRAMTFKTIVMTRRIKPRAIRLETGARPLPR